MAESPTGLPARAADDHNNRIGNNASTITTVQMTSLMWLEHPEHGLLPARRLVDCVFALAPNGRILHFHVEQMAIEDVADTVHYRLTATAPHAERSRCQIIPPLVNAFARPA